MTILLVQTLLLMLVAFLLGASLSCLIRRGFAGSGAAAGPSGLVPAGAPAATVDPAATDRFGRALVGGQGAAVPPVFHGQPVVEVQPLPPAEPEATEAAHAPLPPAPPQRDALHPAPVAPAAAADVEPAPAPIAAPASEPPAEQSYTQIAVAAAAAAAVAAARARAEAEAAEAARKAAEEQEAAAAAEAVATAPSRFGTVVEAASLERPAGEPVDDLTRIHGIDAELKERLVRYGVHRFAQIAIWTPDDVRGASQTLGVEAGRIEREGWVAQARILAAGGDPGSVPAREGAQPADTVAPVEGDRLHRIIGIDPDSEALLRANGVTQIVHIAAWSAEDVARFEALLGKPGRITAESWVEQARFLTGWTAASPEPEPQAAEAAAPAQPETAAAAGLRSVRSEALRGEAPLVFTAAEIDDLKRIRGIGVLIEKKLNSLGVTSYEQVANWTEADIARISQVLDFKGRIERENWIEQARILASGGQTEFSRRADRGDA